MPDTLHPPYNITQPRVLQRWLDVNSQNGPLGRTRGFIQIPPFTIPSGLFNQVSDKVFQLNFSSQRNFTLRMDNSLKDFLAVFEQKYCLFIVNIESALDNTNNFIVKRYRLSDIGIAEINADLYVGQLIQGSFFQIEIWIRSGLFGIGFNSTNSYILYTSQLGNQDYRYGVDFPIHLSVPVGVSDFQNNNPNSINTFNLPLIYNDNTINGYN